MTEAICGLHGVLGSLDTFFEPWYVHCSLTVPLPPDNGSSLNLTTGSKANAVT